jgi:hypothetical protein
VGPVDRCLDPDHERALASLAAANTAALARRQADFDRRQAIGCAESIGLNPAAPRTQAATVCTPTKTSTGSSSSAAAGGSD